MWPMGLLLYFIGIRGMSLYSCSVSLEMSQMEKYFLQYSLLSSFLPTAISKVFLFFVVVNVVVVFVVVVVVVVVAQATTGS